MDRAIVYTSASGHTEEYARMLGEATGYPVYSLKTAKKELPKGSEIVYLGWVCAGRVRDIARTAHWKLCAVVAVGLLSGDAEIRQVLRDVHRIPEDVPVFYARGGVRIERLRGVNHMVMSMARKSLRDAIRKNEEDATESDRAFLKLLEEGGSYVSREEIEECIEMLRAREDRE